MERQEIPIRFADLRRLASLVPGYLAQQVGAKDVPSLQAGVEYTFGIIGLDTESLILEFAKAYCVELGAFDFARLLSPDGPTVAESLLFLPAVIYFLALWLIKTVVGTLCWLCDKQLAVRIWQRSVFALFQTSLPPKAAEILTVGDFVASAAVGHFVKRERVYFRLVR